MEIAKQGYVHPMSWIVDKITNEEMMWVLFCQLNDVGTHNLLKFVSYYCSKEMKDKWYKAHIYALDKMEKDKKDAFEEAQIERDKRS